MNKFSGFLFGVLPFALLIAVVVFVSSYEYALWKECRASHSWFYCVRVLSK